MEFCTVLKTITHSFFIHDIRTRRPLKLLAVSFTKYKKKEKHQEITNIHLQHILVNTKYKLNEHSTDTVALQ